MQTFKLGRWAALALALLAVFTVAAGAGSTRHPTGASWVAQSRPTWSGTASSPAAPATGTAPYTVRLPVVMQPPRTLFSDDFEDGIAAWTPFLNLRPLRAEQWYWAKGEGFNGSNGYAVNSGLGVGDPSDGAHDVLAMVLAAGSEQWANYRVRARFNVHGGRQAGVWLRGTYRPSTTWGQWVTGYYFTVDVMDDEAELMQLRTAEEPGDERIPNYWYHYTNPMVMASAPLSPKIDKDEWHQITVEAVGPRLRCFLDDRLLIDWTDGQGSIFLTGTVGLFGYGNCSKGNCAVITFDDVVVEPVF